MKKRDVIKLVKETIAEGRKRYGQHDYYGNNVGGRNSISGMPGVWEGESTSFKVVDADTGKTIDFGIDQAKAEEIVTSAKEDNINAKVVKMKNVDDVGKLDEEGESWGLEPRQLADSFTFDELEQLYNDKKISKEDLNGAKSYLQSWIDMHPTYLPQRDLTSPKRQKIRNKYINENNMKYKIKEATTKSYAGVDAMAAIEKDPRFGSLQGDAKMDLKDKLKGGGTVELEEEDGLPVADTVLGVVDDLLRKIEKYENDAHSAVGDTIVDYRKTKQALHMLRLAVDEDEGGVFNETKYAEPDMDDEDMNTFTPRKGGRIPGAGFAPTGKNADQKHTQWAVRENMMKEYIKERGDSNLMEHMDKHRKRSTLMEGATEKLFKLFNTGKTDLEVRSHYLQMNVDMPESFIAKLRNNWESLRKTKLDLTLADKEAEGFEAIQQSPPVTGMEGGSEEGMEEDKKLASGLFTK